MDEQFKIKNNVLVKYHEQDGITDVVIPEGIIEIGEAAFDNCTSLTNVNIPESVTKIGSVAFNRCIRLSSINIPNSVIEIGPFAFFECIRLTSINIPEGVTEIGMCTFANCASLTEITIPDSVTLINLAAFDNCNSLKTFNIPSYNIFNMLDNMLDYNLKMVALNTIIRDKKQEEYTKEDISKFKEYIINNKKDIFECILENSNNLMDLLYYMLDNNIYTKDELLDLINKCKNRTDISAILLEYSNKNREEKNIESIIEDEFNLDDDIQLKK